jgi:hypothetical protein
MRDQIESVAEDYDIYKARRAEYDTGQKVPFRVAPTPFRLNPEQARQIEAIGQDITSFFLAADELYHTDQAVRELLDTGKPEIFLADYPAQYLFVRPDMIITEKGFSICEVETSPFGLALAEILNRSYQDAGFETMVGNDVLASHVQATTPMEGTIVYSQRTQAYAGQMAFLADNVFSGEGRHWNAAKSSDTDPTLQENVYRGFYLDEYETDPNIRLLLEANMSNGASLLPSPTPHLEEKAILSLIWDKRFEKQLRSQLGSASYDHLRDVIPPTWVVGQEEHFALGLPNQYESSIDLAKLSRSKRTFVLKSSGFSATSSWTEGVHFLGKNSAAVDEERLREARADKMSLHVIQAFHRGKTHPMEYTDQGHNIPMSARIRLTPYYAIGEQNTGELVAIKATGCENTDLIHASSSSINTAVNV